MASTETLKTLSATLSALCAYKRLYALGNEEQIVFNNALKKVYVSLIEEINTKAGN
jgi:hypothetical protein